MATKKLKKKVYKKGAVKSQVARSKRSRLISFFVGVITVIVVGVLIFVYSQSNNYHQVLGTHTQIENHR